MRITIVIESNPNEYSTHFRRNLVGLLNNMGFIVRTKPPSKEEWVGLFAEGSPSEALVDETFKHDTEIL